MSVASLLGVATLKILLIGSGDRLLDAGEPVSGIPFYWVLPPVAALELLAAILLIAGSTEDIGWRVVLVLAANLCVYRIVVASLGPAAQPCPCLGALPGWAPAVARHRETLLTTLSAAWLAAGIQGVRRAVKGLPNP